MPPNRVRQPTGCSFASGCSPPRLAATQLPSEEVALRVLQGLDPVGVGARGLGECLQLQLQNLPEIGRAHV